MEEHLRFRTAPQIVFRVMCEPEAPCQNDCQTLRLSWISLQSLSCDCKHPQSLQLSTQISKCFCVCSLLVLLGCFRVSDCRPGARWSFAARRATKPSKANALAFCPNKIQKESCFLFRRSTHCEYHNRNPSLPQTNPFPTSAFFYKPLF